MLGAVLRQSESGLWRRLPGYGWRVEFSGLERPRQWLGVALATAVVLVVVILITYVGSNEAASCAPRWVHPTADLERRGQGGLTPGGWFTWPSKGVRSVVVFDDVRSLTSLGAETEDPSLQSRFAAAVAQRFATFSWMARTG